jgi:hypothetical protein
MQLIITTKQFRYNIFNLKTKNFKQNIAYLAFIQQKSELVITLK